MKILSILTLSLLVLTPISATASGSSSKGKSSNKSNSATVKRNIDQERYRLGQAVFSNKVKLPKDTISKDLYRQQGQALVKLQKQITAKASARDANNMNAKYLAGRLSAKQLSALRYYVEVRFLKKG